jgi:tRNA threonylcarbamoyladenosine biosynthesis protein TsaB
VSVLVAIEAATDLGSVAIGVGTELTGEVVVGVRSRHAESLLPALDYLMRTARVERRAIRGIVAGAGPGSFTGVRIAAATARGLAQGLGVPLYAYSSLAALALDAALDRPVCAVFDARRGEVYAACYVLDPATGRLHTLMTPDVLTVPALLLRVAGLDPFFVGEGVLRYGAELGATHAGPRLPRASALLRLAAADPEGGRIQDPAGWEPSYIRASGAERGIEG